MKPPGFPRIVWIVVFLTIFLFDDVHSTEDRLSLQIAQSIESLTPEDKKILENGFQELVLWSSFGYTLFGDKPMSFELKPSLELFWNTWEKNRHLFSFRNFFLINFKNNGYFGVLLINKEAMISAIGSNKRLVDEVLEESIATEEIVKSLGEGSGEIFHKILMHKALLGILLGYGNENAWNFHKKFNLGQKAAKMKTRKPFHKPNLFWEVWVKGSKTLLPQFEADMTSEETKRLMKKYKAQKKEIDQIYKDGSFLNETLARLCS